MVRGADAGRARCATGGRGSPNRFEPSRFEPSRFEPSRFEPSRFEPSRREFSGCGAIRRLPARCRADPPSRWFGCGRGGLRGRRR
ncbi:hypothetical protein E3O46_17620 [Cryobacterium glucosi]|uniref:Uncharacterized protein n=1 Tax=Cryobacterium glucosi TaxID=1259175 RepID=A0ABY2IHY3_9MICO|nr:hypothetical protein E3O46_17620 [Cryobacterium glucosi]